MLLTCSNLEKVFPGKKLFSGLSFNLDKNDRLGILGENGCGKSTLLKIISGELPSDGGNITIQSDTTIGYLAQYQDDSLDGSIIDVVLESKKELIKKESELRDMESEMAVLSGDDLKNHLDKYHKLSEEFENEGGLVFRSLATGIIKGLGFSDDEFSKSFSTLSGGQKTRVSLGKLLLSNPDILMLDEPTNHLDIHSVEWLEGFLQGYKGAVILVSHDRYFLDNVIDNVLDITENGTRVYSGNYTDAMQKKKLIYEAELKAYRKQQDKIQHEEEVIETLQRFNREKSIKRAESRKKVLDKITPLDAPASEKEAMFLQFKSDRRSGNDVLEVTDLKKQFDDQLLFEGLSFYLGRGDRLGILGDNGTGKTTLLRIINGLLKPDSGEIKIGASVDIGYYDQGQQNLNDDNSVFSELRNSYPDMNNTLIRNTLAAFDFKGDDVDRRVKALSGGERGRLSLAKLMLKKSNLLILDEPTNHLDIKSKEKLEDALLDYDGTILFVSHDRYFINRIANRILVLNGDSANEYIGNYDDYLAKSAELDLLNNKALESASYADSSDENKIDYDKQKQEKAKRKKVEKEIASLEEEIERLETLKSDTENEMADSSISSDSGKLNELNKILVDSSNKIEEAYAKWDELSELLQ